MRTQIYPSDLNDPQWALIESDQTKGSTKQRGQVNPRAARASPTARELDTQILANAPLRYSRDTGWVRGRFNPGASCP